MNFSKTDQEQHQTNIDKLTNSLLPIDVSISSTDEKVLSFGWTVLKPEYHNTVRRVSFGDVEIRSYFTALGDNPGSMCGAPVSLSWDFDVDAVNKLHLDEYESQRGTPRKGRDLFLDPSVREAILMECGFDLREIIIAANRATLDRQQRRKTVTSLRYAAMHEAIEKVSRKIKSVRHLANKRGPSIIRNTL
mmetsp:Transcript_28238/g.40439  ORF Transcript_28238/g.40439 Transcript_28238/m.40439 type:complete len:191 (-) Transcript_28238:101-673(-)